MTVGVLGAGSWGTALAQTIAENGYQTYLSSRHRNVWLSATPCTKKCQVVILAVPSWAFREVCQRLKEEGLPEEMIIIGTCKGLEKDTLYFASQIIEEVLGEVRYGHLGGPGFAKGLLQEEDTRLVIASEEEEVRIIISQILSNRFLSLQQTDDLIGLQVAGATRTPLSIARGAAFALGFGQRKNTMAAMFGRALAENARLAVALGGKIETFVDVAGAGDLSLCDNPESRNFLLGQRIVNEVSEDWSSEQRVDKIREIVKEIGTVEGYQTSKALYLLARKHGVEMPWIEEVYQVCHQGKPITQAIKTIQKRHMRRA
jgi:glycerol-3-phosphate dehydrogenase (NAD(P)+)